RSTEENRRGRALHHGQRFEDARCARTGHRGYACDRTKDQTGRRPGRRSRTQTRTTNRKHRSCATTELTRGGTMSVTLHLPTVLSRLADGRKAIEIEGTTVRDVIDRAATQFPQLAPRLRDEQGEPYAFVTFYLNDDDIRLRQGFDTQVEAGDELTVVPAIAGG